MKRLIGSVICAAALLVGNVASAAPVEITAVQRAPGAAEGSVFFDVFVELTAAVAISGIQLYAPHTSAFEVAAGIPYAPGSSAISLTTLGGTTGFQALISSGAPTGGIYPTLIGGPAGTNVLFGTFTALDGGSVLSDLSSFVLYGYECVQPVCDEELGGFEGDTVLDIQGNALASAVHTVYNPVPPPVPEPVAILMIGVALAGLGFARRTA